MHRIVTDPEPSLLAAQNFGSNEPLLRFQSELVRTSIPIEAGFADAILESCRELSAGVADWT